MQYNHTCNYSFACIGSITHGCMQVITYGSLETPAQDKMKALLSRLVVLKLNGGLGSPVLRYKCSFS